MSDRQPSEQFSARELAEQAGVTIRTVHYYVSEGLLPPPEGSTRGATYGPGHLARLRVIAALRDEGLSLAAIRSRLAPLSDDGVIGVLETLEQFNESIEAGTVTSLGLIEASVADHTSEPAITAESLPETPQVARIMMSAPASDEPARPDSARSYVDRMLKRAGKQLSRPAPQPRPQPTEPAPEAWYHFEIEDGIELRVSAGRFHQNRPRILTLVDAIRDLARRQRGR